MATPTFIMDSTTPISVCGIVYMFIIGSVKSFGVVYTELLDYYGTGAGSTAWISSLCFLLLMGLGKFIAAQANYNTSNLVVGMSNLVVVMSERTIKLLWICRIFELTIIKYTCTFRDIIKMVLIPDETSSTFDIRLAYCEIDVSSTLRFFRF